VAIKFGESESALKPFVFLAETNDFFFQRMRGSAPHYVVPHLSIEEDVAF